MPFGLCNAAQNVHRLMDNVLQDIEFVFVYLNDILVASIPRAEHTRHLRLLFKRLTEQELVVNTDKCKFGVNTIDFLGHRVIEAGTGPLAVRVDAINRFPRKGLQEFLGMLNLYHRFVPHTASLLHPLHGPLKSEGKSLERTATMNNAICAAKEALATAVFLVRPRHAASTSITAVASSTAIGASLAQYIDGHWQPLAFFSNQLR